MPKMQYHERNDTAIGTCQQGLRPLLYWIQYRCARDGEDFLIIEGHRNEEKQNKEYEEGSSEAVFPWSFHNHGAAIDLVPVVFGKPWYLGWSALGRYKRIAAILKQWGFEWGGDWKQRDNPHFQYTQGKQIINFVDGYKIKKEEYIERVKASIEIENLKLQRCLERAMSAKNKKRAKLLQDELNYLLEVREKVL